MASPQKENGYTSIANEILEKLNQTPINGCEFRLCFTVIRKTYGFHKKVDFISLSQFSEFTGLKRANVCRTLKSLVAKRLLLRLKNGYSFNKNWEQWVVAKRLPSSQTIQSSSQTATKSSSQTATYKRYKDIYTKETKNAVKINRGTEPIGSIIGRRYKK